jgi:hypothetical protein
MPTILNAEILVNRPGDFVNTNSLLRIGISPAKRFCGFDMSLDVLAQRSCQISNRSEDPAADHVALDLGEPQLHLV